MALSLQVTRVQNWVIDRVTGYLNENSNFKTDIGRIQLSWWDALELENLTIRDHKDSLMIGAEKAHADFSLLSLIPPGDFVVDAVRLDRGAVNFITHKGDTALNINLWIKELGMLFGSKDTTAKAPVNFSIGSIQLRQTTFSLINNNANPVVSGFDYTNIQFRDIIANAVDFQIKKWGNWHQFQASKRNRTDFRAENPRAKDQVDLCSNVS